MARTKTFRGCQIYETQGEDVSECIPNVQEQGSIPDPGDIMHEDVHVTDIQGNVRVRRGATYARDIWSLPNGHKVIVGCNELAQPIEKAAGILSSWLGTVARNGRMCPLDFEDWRHLKKRYGNYLLGQVKLKFSFPKKVYVDGWILASLDQKWRNFIHALKKKFVTNDALEDTPERELRKIEISNRVPRCIEASQWKNLVEYWFSEKSVRRSNAGKLAKHVSLERGINLHTTGSKSYARKKKEFSNNNGRDPGKIEFFEITHIKKRKDNDRAPAFINKISREKVEEAKRLVEERSCESEASCDTIETEVCNEVFGCHKWGVPKGYGLGVRNSEYHVGYSLGRIITENEEIKGLKSEMNDMKEIIKDLKIQNQAFISLLSRNVSASATVANDHVGKTTATFGNRETYTRRSQDVGFSNLLGSNGDYAHEVGFQDGLSCFLGFMGDGSTLTPNFQVPDLSNGPSTTYSGK